MYVYGMSNTKDTNFPEWLMDLCYLLVVNENFVARNSYQSFIISIFLILVLCGGNVKASSCICHFKIKHGRVSPEC